eukprot:1157727-Pelagomonas_calceolata.AAC.1
MGGGTLRMGKAPSECLARIGRASHKQVQTKGPIMACVDPCKACVDPSWHALTHVSKETLIDARHALTVQTKTHCSIMACIDPCEQRCFDQCEACTDSREQKCID